MARKTKTQSWYEKLPLKERQFIDKMGWKTAEVLAHIPGETSAKARARLRTIRSQYEELSAHGRITPSTNPESTYKDMTRKTFMTKREVEASRREWQKKMGQEKGVRPSVAKPKKGRDTYGRYTNTGEGVKTQAELDKAWKERDPEGFREAHTKAQREWRKGQRDKAMIDRLGSESGYGSGPLGLSSAGAGPTAAGGGK